MLQMLQTFTSSLFKITSTKKSAAILIGGVVVAVAVTTSSCRLCSVRVALEVRRALSKTACVCLKSGMPLKYTNEVSCHNVIANNKIGSTELITKQKILCSCAGKKNWVSAGKTNKVDE